jgi:cytochrome bd ubiquinol oxidase subunit II
MDIYDVWFLIVGALFAGYAVLDGFDLGVGSLHLFAKGDTERRVMINSIGPVWDGNEVWLVVGGGALFAAFPDVYATVFSGFDLAMMLVLFMLIFRAAAIEFRSKHPSHRWRQSWDISFCVSSLVAGFLFGVALGNVIRGIPLDQNGDYTGTFLDLLTPYTTLCGVTTVALFMMHGANYLELRTEGEMQQRVRIWMQNTIIFFALCYFTLTMSTLIYVPIMADHVKTRQWLFIVPILTMLAIANIPRSVYHGQPGRAFASSCLAVLGLWTLVGIGMYPDLVIADPESRRLTIHNAASSESTLRTMLIIALIGMPLVLGYTVAIYWIFRGKVRLDHTSY